jgi:cell division protein FtsB
MRFSLKIDSCIPMSFIGKVFVGVLTVLIAAVVISFGTVLSQTLREYENFREQERRTVERLEHLRREREHKEEYLRLVLNDPGFLEKVVRERLGYVRPDETVFLFEDRR